MIKQKGAVLFFSLIVLLLMTVIAVALSMSSAQSLKMSAASSERIEAMAAAMGVQNRLISENQGGVTATLLDEVLIINDELGVRSHIVPLLGAESSCQRKSQATEARKISCRRMSVSSSINYGRHNSGHLTLVTGIEKEVLTGN